MNEKNFEYIGHHGTVFKAERCDFRGGVTAVVREGTSTERLMVDVSEMIGYHAVNIFPQLNGFAGYDCISYKISQA